MFDQIPESITFNYELIKQIGEGAMGETWLIKNRVNKSMAALKCLKLNTIKDLKSVELFKREAELLQSIHVEGVPKFLDYLTDDAGNGYLLQEYIQAESIQDFLDNNYIFPEDEALDIVQKLARIIYELQTYYSPPIIHRDIKPSNILYDDQNHRVYLIDFGSVTHPQKKTGGSTIAGTFGYMPPEQMVNDVVIQSDYYAIGATLLHMLTGKFPGNMSSEMFQIDFVPIIKENAPQTTERTIYILKKLLSKDPEERSKTPYELIELLSSKSSQVKSNIFVRIFNYLKALFSSTPSYINDSSHKTHKSLKLDQAITKLPEHENDSTNKSIAMAENTTPTDNPTPNQTDSSVNNQETKIIDPKVAINEVITVKDTESNSDPSSRCTLVTHNWEKCEGIIQRQLSFNSTKGNQPVRVYALEFTFNVNGFTYVGRCYSPYSLPHCNYPFPCLVIYNPKYPTRNALYSFDKEAFVKSGE